MYLRNIKRLQGIYLVIQESYYDSSARQSRTRTVESLGYLEALKKQYDDPVAFFTQRVKEMTMQKKINGDNKGKINYCDGYVYGQSEVQIRNSKIGFFRKNMLQIKYDNAMEVQYMLFSEMLSQERIEGREEGIQTGRQKTQQSIFSLIDAMNHGGDGDKVSLITGDPELLQKMCDKYHISI